MRKYFNDFTTYTRLADGGLRITLMEEGRDPTFGEIHAGEQVLLIAPGELMAVATVQGPVRRQGLGREHVYWMTASSAATLNRRMLAMSPEPLEDDGPRFET